jgi:hypothetical protein
MMITMDTEDETAITEITIQPDGRIFVFGLSLEVARALSGLCPPGHAIGRLIERLQPEGKMPADFRQGTESEQPAECEQPIGLTESER